MVHELVAANLHLVFILGIKGSNHKSDLALCWIQKLPGSSIFVSTKSDLIGKRPKNKEVRILNFNKVVQKLAKKLDAIVGEKI